MIIDPHLDRNDQMPAAIALMLATVRLDDHQADAILGQAIEQGGVGDLLASLVLFGCYAMIQSAVLDPTALDAELVEALDSALEQQHRRSGG